MKLLYQDHTGIVFRRKPNFDYMCHFHNAVEIAVFVKGTCRILYGKESFNLSGGDAFVAFPNQIHGYEESADLDGYLLIVPLRACHEEDRNMLMSRRPVCPCLKVGQWESNGIFTLLEMAQQEKNDATPTVMQGYVRLIISKLLTALPLEDGTGETGEALRAVLQYLDGHYTQTVTRKDISQAIGYHESYISHIFSETLGMTIPEYINSLRIYDAQEMLRSTQLAIAQIASDLGFGSIRNFNRAFLKETGMSPTNYRAIKMDEI